MTKLLKREIYQSVLPTIMLLATIIYAVYIFTLPDPSHMHSAGLAKVMVYVGLVGVIGTLVTALYLTWLKNVFWLTKVLNILLMVVLGSVGSLMLMVYALEFIHNATV